jgi:hypothetical protein
LVLGTQQASDQQSAHIASAVGDQHDHDLVGHDAVENTIRLEIDLAEVAIAMVEQLLRMCTTTGKVRQRRRTPLYSHDDVERPLDRIVLSYVRSDVVKVAGAGCSIKVDQLGNIFARREGRDPSKPPVT